ncbi:TonB-dependent receptor [Oleisolibacter albus]|uniref:TonB-dependent receptor n=1 Tax=Oleisolibacter albus TaxID=2171757 RepID=UPI0012D7342D|nr:TonB-dependent receptor [Oleisolibacter albus]
MRARLGAGVALLALMGQAAAAEPGTAPGDAPMLDEVVVTGEKQGRSLHNTPSSVHVVGSEQIEAEGLVDLYDVLDRTANAGSRAGKAGVTIRGIDAFGVSGAGNGMLASIYVDGAVLPRRAVQAANLAVWDVKQVEVLRGPQSTLQGRNALAGAIVLRTEDPGFDWSGKARLVYGEGGRHEAAAAIGGPLVADELAFRLSAEATEKNGFSYNPVRDEYADRRTTGSYRAKMLYTPKALPDLEVKLSASHLRSREGTEFVDITNGTRWDDRANYSNDPNKTETDTNILVLDVGYALSDQVTLTSLTTWNRSDYRYRADQNWTPSNDDKVTIDDVGKTVSQELRANLDLGRLTGIVGAYYAHIDEPTRSTSQVGLSLAQAGVAGLLTAPPSAGGFGLPTELANQVLALYPAQLPIYSQQNSPQTVETYAVFTDLTYALTDRLKLNAGLRWDREDQTRAVNNSASLRTSLPDPANPAYSALVRQIVAGINGAVNAQLANATSAQPESSADFTAVLPKGGVTYDWTPDLATSAMVQRGYRSGGVVVNTARSTVVAFDPEYTWNYELSLRSRWLDRRLTVNANLFYVDWTDQQVNVRLSGNIYDTQTENAGKSHLWGGEVETSYAVTRDLDLYASVGYTRTRFDDFVFSTQNLEGNEFAFAPRWSLAAGGTWRFADGFFAALNANYRSAAYAEAIDEDKRLISARTLVNARLGYERDKYGLYLYADNLLDQRYYATRYASYRWAGLGDPRTVGVMLEARF